MALTDREIIKQRQAGQAGSYNLAGSAVDAVAAMHTHSRDCAKTGTENAATNVAETVMFVSNRKGQTKTVKYLNGTNVAANTTDYMVMTVAKSTAGAASTPIATYNTAATAVGGAITKWIPASFIVSPNADSVVAVGDVVTYKILKYGAGQVADPGAFTVDIEAT